MFVNPIHEVSLIIVFAFTPELHRDDKCDVAVSYLYHFGVAGILTQSVFFRNM